MVIETPAMEHFTTAAEANETSQLINKRKILMLIVRGLGEARNNSVMSTTIIAQHDAEMQTTLETLGYTVSHDGTSWSIGWAGAVATGANVLSPIDPAYNMMVHCTGQGENYVCQTLRDNITKAIESGLSSVTVELAYNANVETALIGKSYTVSHDGVSWLVSW